MMYRVLTDPKEPLTIDDDVCTPGSKIWYPVRAFYLPLVRYNKFIYRRPVVEKKKRGKK